MKHKTIEERGKELEKQIEWTVTHADGVSGDDISIEVQNLITAALEEARQIGAEEERERINYAILKKRNVISNKDMLVIDVQDYREALTPDNK